MTDEHKRKISEARKGKTHSDGTRKKMSEIRKKNPIKYWEGKKMSLEIRKKISEAQRGEKGNNWGKTASEETKRKMSKAHKGEKSHFWKGGKMAKYPEIEKTRKSLEYRLWRKAVFERDNFTCQKYGIKGGRLVAHHINNFVDFLELRLAINNGITLSKKAHIEFHKKYGNANNTKEQLEEFLC